MLLSSCFVITSNSQQQIRDTENQEDCAKDGINPFATSLEIFCSICAKLRTAFQQLFTFWVLQLPEHSRDQKLSIKWAFKQPCDQAHKYEAHSTIPWTAFQFSACTTVRACHIAVIPQDGVFGKQFIWELHNILNSPKYILLDPYKRNLNKYNSIKLNLLQQILNIYFH